MESVTQVGSASNGSESASREYVRYRRAIDPAVASVFEVEIVALKAPTRGSAEAAFARQVAMYLAHVVCGLSLTEVGLIFGRDRTTVAHACEVVEDCRDEPELDRRLEHLERAVASLADAVSLRQR
jgi:chromosomal replication initiation ATPase DnaA